VSETRSDVLVRQSRLYQDVNLDHRDAMYRAMTFIERRGGPKLPDHTKEDLIAHREQARDWLLGQLQPGDLLTAYDLFVERWSPVFPDE
jgi:hypothetical protein